MKDVIGQGSTLRKILSLGTTVSYPRLGENTAHVLRIMVFTDVGRQCDNGQLCYLAGPLIDDMEMGSMFHALSWSSHKSKRPDRSIGADEILAAGEAIDKGKMLSRTATELFREQVPLFIALDSKDFFYSALDTTEIDRQVHSCGHQYYSLRVRQ